MFKSLCLSVGLSGSQSMAFLVSKVLYVDIKYNLTNNFRVSFTKGSTKSTMRWIVQIGFCLSLLIKDKTNQIVSIDLCRKILSNKLQQMLVNKLENKNSQNFFFLQILICKIRPY